MNAEASIGEILSAYLSDVSPDDLDRQLLGRARGISAWRLAGEVAPLIGSTANEVFDAMTYVPNAMLPLLDSPEGWTALAGYVAADLRRGLPAYKPTIH